MGKSIKAEDLREQRGDHQQRLRQLDETLDRLTKQASQVHQQIREVQDAKQRVLGSVGQLNDLLVQVDPDGPEATAQGLSSNSQEEGNDDG